mmetsp:Transcript_32245/g.51935  ORF Transcript_32245/g.51935 Transcript_32245/m.51935 type:complete len:217 (+) Transcript_32245:729-1379(+)
MPVVTVRDGSDVDVTTVPEISGNVIILCRDVSGTCKVVVCLSFDSASLMVPPSKTSGNFPEMCTLSATCDNLSRLPILITSAFAAKLPMISKSPRVRNDSKIVGKLAVVITVPEVSGKVISLLDSGSAADSTSVLPSLRVVPSNVSEVKPMILALICRPTSSPCSPISTSKSLKVTPPFRIVWSIALMLPTILGMLPVVKIVPVASGRVITLSLLA